MTTAEFSASRPRRSLSLLTSEPTPDELATDWTLSESDREQVLSCLGQPSRRRFAVQLCMLRRSGRFLEANETVPLPYVNHLAMQLDHEASCLSLLCNAVLVWNTVQMGERRASACGRPGAL